MGTALERRGVIATYELHDRLGANASARRRFTHLEPELDGVQERIVEQVRAEGYSVLFFSELFPDAARWLELEASASGFIVEVEDGLAREAAGQPAPVLSRRAGKEFVIRRYPYGTLLGFDDPWLRLGAERRMLDIANAYHRLLTKLEYVDLWYTPPVSKDTRRRVSQNWHRDFNDRHLLKAFIYLVDVDDETGPFEHIPGTEPGGAFSHVWPWRPLGVNYPPLVEFEKWSAALPVRTFTGPKGTLLFCNTAGFHRGGFATEKPRVLATFTYDSAAALKALSERNFTFAGGNGQVRDEVVRYALT
ncbi:MAG TPA: hypothetical protein VFR38_07115 [Gaiellaceae bacterium]|nr:hypothetical protein [Gaiellaceae bacterium]